MHTMTRYGTDSRLAIFHPPYLELEPIDTAWVPPTLPLPGRCIVWWLVDGRAQDREFQWLHDRPAGLPLIVVLPPASDIGRAMPLLNYVASLAPRAVLPNSRLVSPPRLQHILATPPQRLSVAAFEYLDRRQLLVDRVVRLEVRRILELVPEVRSVSRLASRLYSSRRTLGRHFAAAGLPVPSHWLQFARLLYVATRLQQDRRLPVFRAAAHAGYPDGFTMSNQMKRLTNYRPTVVRKHLGWEWFIEAWLCAETRSGSIDHERYGSAIGIYIDRPTSGHVSLGRSGNPTATREIGVPRTVGALAANP
ncbi:MAG TPA: helix-turn-helix domain-containing protein [Longimicrobiales bacterium]|nr:helix-turn-helix domain-containing protein [Longimicrobiales bacterium]